MSSEFYRTEDGGVIFRSNGKRVGTIVRDVDGSYIYFNDHAGRGANSLMMRAIADLLDAMNASLTETAAEADW